MSAVHSGSYQPFGRNCQQVIAKWMVKTKLQAAAKSIISCQNTMKIYQYSKPEINPNNAKNNKFLLYGKHPAIPLDKPKC
jgi:hypothetical protein